MVTAESNRRSATGLSRGIAAAAQTARRARWRPGTGDPALSVVVVTVIVRQPEVKHMVEIDEFEKWLREPSACSPAKMSRESRAQEILGIKD